MTFNDRADAGRQRIARGDRVLMRRGPQFDHELPGDQKALRTQTAVLGLMVDRFAVADVSFSALGLIGDAEQ